jgi:hypothetical protein
MQYIPLCSRIQDISETAEPIATNVDFYCGRSGMAATTHLSTNANQSAASQRKRRMSINKLETLGIA